MDSDNREHLAVEIGLSAEPEISRWLWALQDTRQRTLETLKDLTQATMDWQPEDKSSSIGTVLYHMTDIEADWLFVEVLEQEFPADVAALFPYPTRDKEGRLTQVSGYTLEDHLARLETVRNLLLDAYQQMDLADFRKPRTLPQYHVTPEWVLHHLIQHEAEHRGQIGSMRARAEGKPAPD